jgi:hypothetical protein
VSGNGQGRIVIFTDVDMVPTRQACAEAKFKALVKTHMAETGKNERWSAYAVALTPEGRAAWEEARGIRARS